MRSTGSGNLRPTMPQRRALWQVSRPIGVETAMGINIESAHGKVSLEEWEARVNLAAAYRLVALFGWDDLVFTHISARIPGPGHHFLINPYGMMFEEITASSLVN